MSVWIFRDYVNRRGDNEIHAWLHRLPLKVRARINTRIDYLAGVRYFDPRDVKLLHGECEGLLELRIEYGNVEYRPIGCFGPTRGIITLLLGAVERNDRFDPPDACVVAKRRKADVESDMEQYSCVHDPR